MTHLDNTRTTAGMSLVVIGIALMTISTNLHGFAHGLMLGAGIVFTLIAIAMLAMATRGTHGWLPSRDRDEPEGDDQQ